jgi:hypothetical protein
VRKRLASTRSYSTEAASSTTGVLERSLKVPET